MPPDSGSWQARALIFSPSPQVAVHWDQSPQSCHWAGTTAKISSNKSERHHFLPGHSVSSHSCISVELPGHTGLLPDSESWQARALILIPSPHVDVHSDHSPQSCHWAGTTAIFCNKIQNQVLYQIKAINLVSRTPPSPFPLDKCRRLHRWQRTRIPVECASLSNCSRSNRSIEASGLKSTSSLSDVQNKIFTWHHVLYLESPNSSFLRNIPIT